MYYSNDWQDYELIDCGGGMKLERWGGVTLLRPDPQAIWGMESADCDARYERIGGGGQWHYNRQLPESWRVQYKQLRFIVRPTGFKHTGLFPEQACNWDWLRQKIEESGKSVNVLNLFAYTGGATVACASAGASVTHVDAAKGMVAWARQNAADSGLAGANIKYYVDDCVKLVAREIRRGNKYQGIIMDPPSYGRGPDGEMWKIEQSLYPLIESCAQLLEEPVFFLINSYTTGLAPAVLKSALDLAVTSKFGGSAAADEIGLFCTRRNICLPCGAAGRWCK